MQDTPPMTGFANHLELRRINRATVERYMHMKGAERLQRHTLFSEDGCGGNWTTQTGEPLVFQGHESLARLAQWLEQCFPDWEWHNVRIFETDDPNHLLVECDGRGKVLARTRVYTSNLAATIELMSTPAGEDRRIARLVELFALRAQSELSQ